jgi:hypothetical protein
MKVPRRVFLVLAASFASALLSRAQEPAPAAAPRKITVTAKKYEFKCAKFCGFGHGKMKGEILVTAPEPPRN